MGDLGHSGENTPCTQELVQGTVDGWVDQEVLW